MTDRDLREEEPPPRRKRRGLLGNLAKVARPPMTTPQWKDAVREQEARGPKKDKDE